MSNIPNWVQRRNNIKENIQAIKPKNGFFYKLNEQLISTSVFNFLYIILTLNLYMTYDLTHLSEDDHIIYVMSQIINLSSLALIYYIIYLRSIKIKRKSLFLLAVLSDLISFTHVFNLFVFLIELTLDIFVFIIANYKTDN